MNRGLSFLACFLSILLASSVLQAKEVKGFKKSQKRGLRTSSNCLPSSASTNLDINNVRCLLHNGGDMWWDLANNPRYEIPKVDDPALARHSSFAASLWIGGVDNEQNLKVAAQTYRQSGNDFFPGPLTETGAITSSVCEGWDKMWKINKSEIDAFRSAFHKFQTQGTPLNMDDFPNVRDWPAYGENADGFIAMAPYVNVDNNTLDYNPEAGDYPDIRPIEGGGEPDQAVWWVINDKGDIHTETGGAAIGLEIQMMAFAFTTSNAVNDMTFYKYKVINKSGTALTETYMGQWVDADIGNPWDDYVGCDIDRGLGFAYNGDAEDETEQGGYGLNPPAFGMDFFQGPKDEHGNRLDMTRFVYYQNDFSLIGNPEQATHYYGYLRGFWKDGSQMTYGGNGYGGTTPTDFMFPGDPAGCGTAGWSEVGENTPVGDRRFLQSAGPFTLQNGAINEIITGAVWSRDEGNANLGSICGLYSADDLAQALFDANFQLLDGPDAPVVQIEELDRELIINWDYDDEELYNNFNESYAQVDPVLQSQNESDPEFQFQGYMVFQLKDGTVSASELFDTDKARLVAQCDIKDGITTIVNRKEEFLTGLPDPVIVDQVMVQGEDKGIFHSVRTTEDLFADGSDRRLKNYMEYHYAVIAYAHNDIPSDGRKFVQGNGNFSNMKALPHKVDFENYGTIINSEYGDGMKIIQDAGVGNGGRDVSIHPESESFILANGSTASIIYQSGKAPVNVKVVNPKEIIKGDYRLVVVENEFQGTVDTVGSTNLGPITERKLTEWILYESGNEVYRSTYIERDHPEEGISNRPEPLSGVERVIKDHGISIGVGNAKSSGLIESNYDPVISASVTYSDPMMQWLSGYRDLDDLEMANWILSGQENSDRGVVGSILKDNFIYDPDENFEDILNGSWSPMCLARQFTATDVVGVVAPGIPINTGSLVHNLPPDSAVNLSELPDIDIVITPDRNKWSRCVVVETAPNAILGSGANTLSAKWQMGLNANLEPMGSTLNSSSQGWSMFPGYAIDVNTGRRLNIFFGENSWDKENNGGDMLFNPTNDIGGAAEKLGGRHYIYVSNTTYDGCTSIHPILANENLKGTSNQLVLDPAQTQDVWTNNTNIGRVYKDISWVGIPMMSSAVQWTTYDQIPTETRISLRVNHPYHSRTGTNDKPEFTFNTSDIAAAVQQQEVAKKSLMECVRVVPNPYYGFSKYEKSQLQTIVKITNLPQRCKIRIFTLNGTLVRDFNKDSDSPEQEWDLKNQAGVPVAGGVYIIHVDGYELGETVVKLMTIMPQVDLTSY